MTHQKKSLYKKTNPWAYLVGLLVIILSVACEDYKNCNSPVETSLGISFYHRLDGKDRDSVLPSLSFHPVQIQDTTIQLNTKAIFVPLDPHYDTTYFYIRPDSSLIQGDTIAFLYTNDLHFVSSGCGFKNVYKLDSALSTHHYIDSITIKDNKVDVTNTTNIKIYY